MREGLTNVEYSRLKRILLEKNREGRYMTGMVKTIVHIQKRDREHTRLVHKATAVQLKRIGYIMSKDEGITIGRDSKIAIE